MNFADNNILEFLLRDFLQVIVVGLIIPVYLLAKGGAFKKAGLRFDRPRLFLIGIIIAGLLFLQFLSEGSDLSKLNISGLNIIFYIMAANIFEIIFFAAYLRYEFEKAFGIIPSIILSAMFFSLHHIGFQPEFLKLFLVGLTFISIMRIPNHWFIIIPAWWVGGVFDVLIKAQDIADISRVGWIRPCIILAAIATILLWKCLYSAADE